MILYVFLHNWHDGTTGNGKNYQRSETDGHG